MHFDVKNQLLKSSVGGNMLSQKNINTTIDQSMVASTEQKSLGMDLKDKQSLIDKEKEKKKKEAKLKKAPVEKNEADDQSKKIERDPLKLLRLF